MTVFSHCVVIGAADPVTRAHLRRIVNDRPRLRLRGEAETAVTTLYVAASMKPALVVLADESPGIRGRDVVEEIVAEAGGALVVLLTAGDPASAWSVPGVARALADDDIEGVGRALDDLIAHLESPVSPETPERRQRGVDRRQKQDWSKVFAERRGNRERREAV